MNVDDQTTSNAEALAMGLQSSNDTDTHLPNDIVQDKTDENKIAIETMDAVMNEASTAVARDATENDGNAEQNENEDGESEENKVDSKDDLIRASSDAREERETNDDAMNEDVNDEDSNVRRTKRRRSSVTLNRYSPGEGGGLKKHKANSSEEKDPAVVESSQVVIKSVDKVVETKKKEKNKVKSEKVKNETYPIYHWVDKSIPAPNSTIIAHTSLSINFGRTLTGEGKSPQSNDDGTWKCLKCHNNNISTKSRCGVCLSWKGGKRENYPRRSSDGPATLTATATSSKITIKVGDDVLISGGDAPWKELNRLASVEEMVENKQEVSLCYHDPASNEPGLAVLDPHVARVEGMWEETNGNDGETKGSGARMMIKTRWYLKKEDVKGLKCNLTFGEKSNVKERIVADMTVRDLILSDQIDVNSVHCILGKTSITPLDVDSKQKIRGGFICRYKLNLDPGNEYMGTISPMVDSVQGNTDTNRRGLDVGTSTSSEDETYQPRTDYSGPLSPRRVMSEGPTVGKIKVGLDYQAVIPEQLDFESNISSRDTSHPPLDRTPMMVWNPTLDKGDIVDSFVSDACSMLSKSMKQKPFHELNCIESPDPKAEANKPREVSIDSLLMQLHECKYNRDTALEKVSANPEKFLVLWNNEERDQFDSNFRVYRDSLRMISKNLSDSKTCKDVVEYHYRFKLIENFRRFKEKKQEQAREMMETAEYRMLKEKRAVEARNEINSDDEQMSSDEDGTKPVTSPVMPSHRDGPVNSRIRNWFKTGCSKSGNEGATQLRRNRACSFLIDVKNQIGSDAYLALAKCLKSHDFQSKSSLVELKASAQDIMKSHPSLFEQFIEFLPEKIY